MGVYPQEQGPSFKKIHRVEVGVAKKPGLGPARPGQARPTRVDLDMGLKITKPAYVGPGQGLNKPGLF